MFINASWKFMRRQNRIIIQIQADIFWLPIERIPFICVLETGEAPEADALQ